MYKGFWNSLFAIYHSIPVWLDCLVFGVSDLQSAGLWFVLTYGIAKRCPR